MDHMVLHDEPWFDSLHAVRCVIDSRNTLTHVALILVQHMELHVLAPSMG